MLQHRLGAHSHVVGVPYGEALQIGPVRVSFHPAGHILGSAQIRLEHQGEVWVYAGDYATHSNPTCTPFEPVRCHTFITESTFARPHFAWPEAAALQASMRAWWQANQQAGCASFVYSYALGKAQRVIACLQDEAPGPLVLHEQVADLSDLYRAEGVRLAGERHVGGAQADWSRSLFVLPPSARFRQPFPILGPYRTAFASGWMLEPDGPERFRVETGFVLSDHADHAGLLWAVEATGAERVLVTHGAIDLFVDELRSRGLDAHPCSAGPTAGSPQADNQG